MSRRHFTMLFLLAALWGASFMFIKIGDRELHPFTLVGFRMTLGALTLVPIVLATVGPRRALTELRAAAWPLAVVGLTNSAIPILSITWAETRIDSGLTAIIQASAPLFTALLAIRFSQDERVRGSRLAGLVVGFAGVAMLVGRKPSGELVAAFAVVFGAVLLGEPVTVATVGGLALVLAGVALGTGALRVARPPEGRSATFSSWRRSAQ